MNPFQHICVNTMFRGLVYLGLLSSVLSANANVCVYKPPRVKRVCGVIVDSSGEPLQGVSVELLRNGILLQNVKTDGLGTFDLDAWDTGEYELSMSENGFTPGRYRLTLTKAQRACKRALKIEMSTFDPCGGEITETKKPLPVKR